MAIRLLSSENITGSITTASGQSISNAGKIIMQSDGTLDWGATADYGNLTWDTGKAIIAGLSGKALEFRTNASSVALTLDTSQNATFESNVTTGGTITVNNVGADKKIAFRRTSANNWSIEHDSSQLYFYNETSSKDILLMKNGGQIMLGEYGSGTFTGTTAYTLAVDSSGNIIETTDGGGDITGSGTANKVAKFTGAKAIGDGPITFATNDSTFAGSITGTSAQFIDTSNPDGGSGAGEGGSLTVEGRRDGTANLISLRARDASAPTVALPNGQGGLIRFQGFDGTDFAQMGAIAVVADGQAVANNDSPSKMIFYTVADGGEALTTALTLDKSQNATFAGAVAVNGGDLDVTAGNLTVKTSDNLSSVILQLRNSDNNGYTFLRSHTTGFLEIDGNQTSANGYVFKTDGTAALTIANNSNATFAGELTANGDLIQVSGAHPELKLNDSDDSNYSLVSYSDGDLLISTNHGNEAGAADTIRFSNNGGTERMRIHSSGRVSIGSTTASANTLTLSGTATEMDITNTSTNGRSYRIESDSSGLFVIKDRTANADRIIMDSSGNVGIGGTPGQNLDIQKSGARFRMIDGTNQFNMGLWDGSNYRFEGDANRPIYMTSYEGNINFGISGGTTMTVKNNAVGIGTTTPQFSLEVDGAASALNAHFGQGQNNGSGVFGGISLGYAEANTSYRKVGIVAKAIADTAARQDLHFLVDTVADAGSAGLADSKMSIAATTGYVTINERLGIGNTTPAGDLDVSGPYAFFGTEVADNGITYLTLRNYDSTLVDTNDVQNMIRMTGRYWSGATSQLVETRISSIHQESNGNGGSALGFSTQTGGDTPVEHMRIDKVGNVGIGTTSPDAPLSIHGGTGLGIGASGLRVHRPDSFGQFGFFDYGQSSGTTYIGSSYTGGSAAVYGVIAFRQLSNGGAAKDTMVISSDNNVGIGTTSPSYKLDVVGSIKASVQGRFANGSASTPSYSFDADSDSGMYRATTNSLGFSTGGTNALTIDASQNTSFAGNIAAGVAQINVINNQANSHNIIYRDSTTTIIGGGSSSNKLYVLDNGDVGVNDSSPSYKLDVDGTIRATGDVIAYSDERIKENIKTIENPLNKVDKLRGVEFNKIGEDEKSIGVIAQEIEKILPEVVREDDKGMKSVAYGNITGVLIEAIKELKAEIEELKKSK